MGQLKSKITALNIIEEPPEEGISKLTMLNYFLQLITAKRKLWILNVTLNLIHEFLLMGISKFPTCNHNDINSITKVQFSLMGFQNIELGHSKVNGKPEQNATLAKIHDHKCSVNENDNGKWTNPQEMVRSSMASDSAPIFWARDLVSAQ